MWRMFCSLRSSSSSWQYKSERIIVVYLVDVCLAVAKTRRRGSCMLGYRTQRPQLSGSFGN